MYNISNDNGHNNSIDGDSLAENDAYLLMLNVKVNSKVNLGHKIILRVGEVNVKVNLGHKIIEVKCQGKYMLNESLTSNESNWI